MIIKQKGRFRIVAVETYNGCIPITAYMVQRLDKDLFFLPEKWRNIKAFENRERAEVLFHMLTD